MINSRIISPACRRSGILSSSGSGSSNLRRLSNHPSVRIVNQPSSSQPTVSASGRSLSTSISKPSYSSSSQQQRFYSPSLNFSSSSSSTSPLPISLSLALVLSSASFIYFQYLNPIHNDSPVDLDRPQHAQPGQDSFGDVNPTLLKGGGNMGKEAILTQQEIMRERTRLLGVCGWGSNRYNVVAPDQPSSNVIKSPRWIPYFTGVALRDLILEEKHGVAVDANGDILQWGLGFFDPSCRGEKLNVTEADMDPEAMAASSLPFSEKPSATKAIKRSDRQPISNKEVLPFADPKLSLQALAPVKTLVGKNIIKIHATDTKVYALGKNGDVYVFSALQTLQPKIKAGDWSKNPLTLFGLFNSKQIDHEKIASMLALNEKGENRKSLPRGEKIKDIVGGTNHLLALTSKGRVLSLPADERGNVFGQLGSRRALLNAPGTSSKGEIVDFDLEPRMLASLDEVKASPDPSTMLPSWALPPPNVLANLAAQAEAATLANKSSFSRATSSNQPVKTSSPLNQFITENPESIRFCTTFREIPSLRGVELVQIASGREHSAALTSSGRVVAFGRNTHGQIGLGSQIALECIPTPSEVNLTRAFPPSSSDIKCTSIFLGADNSYFVTSRREGPLKFDSSEFSSKSQAALTLASGSKIDVLACGKGQWGGLGNAMWSQVNGNPTKVKTVSGLMEFSESSSESHPVPIYDISIGRPGNVALILDTVETKGHTAFGRDVMVFGFNAAFNLGNGKRSNLAVPQHLPPLPRQIEITVESQLKVLSTPALRPSHEVVEVQLPQAQDKKTKQLREADINSGVLTHMPHKRLQLASVTESSTLTPKAYTNEKLNSEGSEGKNKKKVKVEERILSGASSMAVWFRIQK